MSCVKKIYGKIFSFDTVDTDTLISTEVKHPVNHVRVMGNSLFYHKEHHVALRTLTIFASRSNHSSQVCWALITAFVEL